MTRLVQYNFEDYAAAIYCLGKHKYVVIENHVGSFQLTFLEENALLNTTHHQRGGIMEIN